MTMAEAWGVAPGHHDIDGRWVPAGPQSVCRVLDAMGAAGAPPAPPVVVVHSGQALPLSGIAEVITEDGAAIRLDGSSQPDLPYGYHTLRRLDDDSEARLIVSPRRCHLPPGLRAWGWAAQLYAVRSVQSWGFGDLGDLRGLASWAAHLGAEHVLVNPLGAPLPLLPQEPSPYYPSSRRYRNPLYIRVEEVPGAAGLGERLAGLVCAGRDLNRQRLIERDRVFHLKMRALEEIFAASEPCVEFDQYRDGEGRGLTDYATFCALTEVYGRGWRTWPAALQHPDSPAVRRFRADRRCRVAFHKWLQWLLDRQLAAAAREIGLVHDLPIGVQAQGADAWTWQDTFAHGISVGAPPDPFNRSGQDWAVPPFDPWRLRSAAYEPFIQTVRAAFRHGVGLRIDHVMGLFRLFWIPEGMGPDQGVYVRYPYGELLDILALESHRARAFVVGEDLGTVEDVVREEMADRSILSYRLLWFEQRPPAEYRPESVAALTTHDLPTLAGIWEGSDPDESVRGRLVRYAGITDDQSTDEVALAAYSALARCPSHLVAATLEDALGVAERPNKPGTTDGWPNWSLGLPLTLEQLRDDPRPARLAGVLRR